MTNNFEGIWGMKGRKAEVFLSYCWADEKIVDKVYNDLIKCTQINFHRDKLEINTWGSIREYMQSIRQMDYVILFISETYLKSRNCMYEVLEIMKDIKYKDKIFPAVIYTEIYRTSIQVKFVKYWQDEFSQLKNRINDIDVQNLGSLPEDLKQCQDIAANIIDFLKIVSEMNNPQIDDISHAIEKKLFETGIIEKNIYIFIKFDNVEGFRLDLTSSTEVDFCDWYNIIKSGGEIIINNEYVNEIEKYLKENKKSISEENRKEFHDGIKYTTECGEIMKIMIRKALLENTISDKIKRFSDFVKVTADRCFLHSRQYNNTSESHLNMLEVYNGKRSFKFQISDAEYANVLEKSEGKIKIPYFVYFSEFMNWVTDKSVLENEIIPIYLRINAIKEFHTGDKIQVEDFSYWWISLG